MSLLWAVAPVSIAIGAAVALAQLRGIADASAALRGELQRFGEVRMAVAEVRSASAETRAIAQGLRRG